MKYLKSLLIAILIIILLLLGIIGACAVNPDLSDKIAGFLFTKNDQETLANDANNSTSSDTQETPLKTSPSANNDQASDDYIPSDIYISPDESEIIIPDDVRGFNGYEEPTVSTKEISDPEAEKLSDSIGYGNTGDDLSFDPLFYPYYYMLDDKGKHLYRQIYANASDLNKRFAPIEKCDSYDIKAAMEAVFNDHPELFFLNTAYSMSSKKNGEVAELQLSFNSTANNINSSRAAFDNAAESILSIARSLPSDFEKEKYVHDALAAKISYNLGAPMNQSAYSALVNGSTVCAGYARAFQYIMQKLSIPTYYCTGKAGENHAWNIIKLDDDFYNVDVTWDDTGKYKYDYFNKSDRDYASTHVRKNMSVKLPPCNGTGYQVYEEKNEAPANETSGNSDISASDDNADITDVIYPDENNNSSKDGYRTLEEAGFEEAEVKYNLSDYYNDCYSKILNTGLGSYTFKNVINGSDLLSVWDRAYQTGEYKAAYLEPVMKNIGATSVQLRLYVEQLEGDRYLITHEIIIY